MTVKLRTTGWEIGGEKTPWIWGTINYWDIERSRWRDVLRSYYQAGHRVVSTSVLPRVHQLDSNQYDFGQAKPQIDLPAFLEEVREVGLKAILWVGPRSVPGVAVAGYPDELLNDSECLARDKTGNFVLSELGYGKEIVALPSLIHPKIKIVLQKFADKLKEIINPYIHPDGPVIGIGLTQAPGWKYALAPFSADYNPEVIKGYSGFLKKKYSRISSLNMAYASDFTSFKEIEPPVALITNAEQPDQSVVDWLEFKEDYFIKAAEMLHDLFNPVADNQIPIYLAALPVFGSPNNFNELERTRCYDYIMPDLSTTDFQELARTNQLKDIALQVRYLTRFNAEFNGTASSEQEEVYQFMLGLCNGVRGWDALSPCGSGALRGFITDRSGKPQRPHNTLWENLKEQSQNEGFLDSQLHADIVLLTLPELERTKCCYIQEQLRIDLIDERDLSVCQSFGKLDALTEHYQDLLTKLEQLMLTNQFAALKLKGDCYLNRINKSQLILVPGLTCMSKIVQAQLAQLVKCGNDIIVVGQLPEHPEEANYTSLKELAQLKLKKTASGKKKKTIKIGKLHHLEAYDAAKLLRLIKQIGVPRIVSIDDTTVDIFYHKLRNRYFVSVHNSSSNQIDTVIRREGKFVLKDFWDSNKFWGGNNEIKITLLPESIKIWELISC